MRITFYVKGRPTCQLGVGGGGKYYNFLRYLGVHKFQLLSLKVNNAFLNILRKEKTPFLFSNRNLNPVRNEVNTLIMDVIVDLHTFDIYTYLIKAFDELIL